MDILRRGDDIPAEWIHELFPPERREMELTYAQKERAEDIIADTMAVPLQPVRTFAGSGDGWSNMLVLGDNLQVMKTLLDMKRRNELLNADGTPGIRLVYIDPPFATKKEFAGNREQKAYQDRLAGADFVEFLRRRLILIRELLADDGSIFVHLDNRKVHYVKVAMDEVFGEQNFRNEIMLPGRASKNLQQQFDHISRLNVRHDTLLWYSRRSGTRFKPLWIEKHKAGNPEGHWHHFWSTADRKTMRYELFGITPKTGQWTWSQKKALKAVENYERYEVENGGRTVAEYWRDTGCALDFIKPDCDDGKPLYWRPPATNRLADTVWSGIPVYSSTSGYPTEKNEALLQQIIELASSEGDLLLDGFFGSGTALVAAQRMGRRWVGIDCGKLAIYTAQKRLVNLGVAAEKPSSARQAFTLFNAGLYDFSSLRELPWDDWRFFALQLFGCRPEEHMIGGLHLDGKLKGSSVLVFNHLVSPGERVDLETIRSIHLALGGKVGSKFFIIAPRGVFDFQQDYVDIDETRYYALRIPYSVINELHRRDFSGLLQPSDETAVNETVDAVGFDFIQPPDVSWSLRPGDETRALLKIDGFESRARIRGQDTRGGLETLSMVMLDVDYNGTVFDLDEVHYADGLEQRDWSIPLFTDDLGEQLAVVFMDIYGNESQVVIPAADILGRGGSEA